MSAASAENRLQGVAERVREMRRLPRTEYLYSQWVAPIRDGQLPSRDEFSHVSCRDISSGGIAFIMQDEPDFESLVITLGMPGHSLNIIARVVSVAAIDAVNGEFFRVGCEFVERIEL